MKTIFFAGCLVLAVALLYKAQTRKQEQVTMDYETDQMLAEILSGCMEAFCQDCDMVLAQGTHPYHDDVAAVAYNHSEIYDHNVNVRTWAE